MVDQSKRRGFDVSYLAKNSIRRGIRLRISGQNTRKDQTMVEHNPPPPADSACVPVIPLPIALYVSEGLIFELYDGGQPHRRFSIRWERLVPAKQAAPEAASESPRTVSGIHKE